VDKRQLHVDKRVRMNSNPYVIWKKIHIGVLHLFIYNFFSRVNKKFFLWTNVDNRIQCRFCQNSYLEVSTSQTSIALHYETCSITYIQGVSKISEHLNISENISFIEKCFRSFKSCKLIK